MSPDDKKSQLLLKRAVRALEAIEERTRYLAPPQTPADPQELSTADLKALAASPAEKVAMVSDKQAWSAKPGYEPYTMRDAEREQRERDQYRKSPAPKPSDPMAQVEVGADVAPEARKAEPMPLFETLREKNQQTVIDALRQTRNDLEKQRNQLQAQLADQREQTADSQRAARDYAAKLKTAQKDANTLMWELQAMLDIVEGRVLTEKQNTQYHLAIVALQKIKERDADNDR